MNDLAVTQLAQERHFIRRANERLGLKLYPSSYDVILTAVREGRECVRFVGAGTSKARTIWKVRMYGKAMTVVYDAVSDRLVTCLAGIQRKKTPPKGGIERKLTADYRARRRRLAMR
jgi:hypothetical protein